ncbi:MAG TPA: ABC transporter substrate-binding protein, partial [Methanomassiliicoccales archaeon]|nr:ABC transporter substrate-binding protein [Methanomassiliicoccales archaeon]
AINAAILKTGPMQVEIKLLFAYPAFLKILAYTACSVVEKAYVEANGGTQSLTRNEWMNRHEMGTGPYILKDWSPNNRILLQRWDNYWRGPAELQYVIIKKVQDLGTREMLLFSGQADSIYVPIMFKDDVIGKPGVRTYLNLPMFSINFFGLNEHINNTNPSVPAGDVPSDFFNQTNVRRAFAYALNYTTLLDVIAQGTAIQPNGPIPEGMLGYNTTVPLFTFNLTKAAQYLQNTTDTRTGHTGSYADNGFNLVLYYNSGNLGRQAGCQLLKQGLETLSQNHAYGVTGKITVTVSTLDWPTYLDARAKGWLPMFFLGWQVDYPDPDDFANPFCAIGGAFPIFIGLENATLDGIVKTAASTLNETVRAELYGQVAQSCYDNAYYIWTTQPTNFHVERTWVHGFAYNPTWADLPGLFYDLSK